MVSPSLINTPLMKSPSRCGLVINNAPCVMIRDVYYLVLNCLRVLIFWLSQWTSSISSGDLDDLDMIPWQVCMLKSSTVTPYVLDTPWSVHITELLDYLTISVDQSMCCQVTTNHRLPHMLGEVQIFNFHCRCQTLPPSYQDCTLSLHLHCAFWICCRSHSSTI